MGVLACDRYKCDNIMCDHLIEDYYICGSCLSEFHRLIGDEELPLGEIVNKFKTFMSTEPFNDKVVDFKGFMNEYGYLRDE